MSARFRKKILRQRGHKWHGWGSKKKHRGGGSRGGRGRAGMMKHKKSWRTVNDPHHFGRRGFKPLGRVFSDSINLKDIDRMSFDRNLNEVDLGELGYGKLLGTGRITRALTIKVDFATEIAKKKIEGAGGKVIVPE